MTKTRTEIEAEIGDKFSVMFERADNDSKESWEWANELESYVASVPRDILTELSKSGEELKKTTRELFPDADLHSPTDLLAQQVSIKEAYNRGISDYQSLLKESMAKLQK